MGLIISFVWIAIQMLVLSPDFVTPDVCSVLEVLRISLSGQDTVHGSSRTPGQDTSRGPEPSTKSLTNLVSPSGGMSDFYFTAIHVAYQSRFVVVWLVDSSVGFQHLWNISGVLCLIRENTISCSVKPRGDRLESTLCTEAETCRYRKGSEPERDVSRCDACRICVWVHWISVGMWSVNGQDVMSCIWRKYSLVVYL